MSGSQGQGKHFYRPQAGGNPYASHARTGGGHRHAARAQGTSGAYGRHDARVPAAGDPATHGAVGMRSELGADGHFCARKPRRPHRGRNALIGLAVVLVLAAVGAWLYLNPPFFDVTVNGERRTVDAGTTVQQVVEKGYASPKAGNLIAVDGSVAKQGGGTPFTATVNGTQVDGASATLSRGDDVQIADGADQDETYTEKTETIPHGTSGEDVSSTNLYWAGSIHVLSAGSDGEQVVKTGDVSGKTVTEVTKQPVDAGYNVYTTDTGGDKVIALTFDDGPWPTTTSEILDILKENGAKATFFEIGNQISENADVVKRIHEEGHQIGTHTWDHASGSGRGVDLTRMSSEEQLAEVTKGFDAIDQVVGTKVSRILRAPGGNYHGSVIETLKDTVTAEVGWDVDTEDWRRPGADKIAEAILSVKPGQVVLMHDGGGDRSQTVEALKTALPKLKEQGYTFVTIDELLAYGAPK